MLLIEFRKMFCSPRVYTAAAILVISSILSFQSNYYFYGIDSLVSVGASNLFFFSNIIDSLMLPILAPLVAVLPFSDSVYDEYKNNYACNIILRSNTKKYLSVKAAVNSLSGGLVFVFVFFAEFLLFWFLDPNPSIMIAPPNGLFYSVYAESLFAYNMCYIFHCFVFGFFFALFGFGLAMVSRNKILVYIVPVVLYYVSSTLYQFIPTDIPTFIYNLIPSRFITIYDAGYAPVTFLSQMVVLGLFSILLIVIGYKKRRIGFNNF